MGEDQLDNLELDGPITLKILDGIAWTEPKQMMKVMEDCKVRRLSLELLPLQLSQKSGQ